MSAQRQERALLLARIVGHFERRVNEFLEFSDSHPEALLANLEAEARRLSRDCFAPALEHSIDEQRERVENEWRCECGKAAAYKGDQSRSVESYVGKIKFSRGYYYCSGCHKGSYPLDTAFGIGPGQFTDEVQNGVCRLGVGLPFEPAAGTFAALTGIAVSPREVERLTEGRGAALEGHLAAEREKLLGADATAPDRVTPEGGGVWAVALDAARARFEDGWHDVKAAVVFRAKPKVSEGRVDGARADQLSYVAEVGSMEKAGQRLYAEAVKRGVDPSEDLVICLGDGAPANWNQFATQFPNRVEVLDWWHSVDHIWSASNGLFGEGSADGNAWVEARKAELWDGAVEKVIAALHSEAGKPRGQAAADEIHYFETNKDRMRYDRYREQGYPIGSGTVESACKRLIGARLKQAGMCWKKEGAQAVVSLRAGLLSQRWDNDWEHTRSRRKAA